MIVRRLLPTVALLLPLLAGARDLPGPPASGTRHDAVFTRYSPLSDGKEMIRRLLSPLNARRVSAEAGTPGHALRRQSVDLGQEKFVVHVPAHAPAHGYALLVFVPPWDDARLPTSWISALDRHGTIFVSPTHAGNDADVLDRREPLALLAAYNIAQSYPVDPQHVYVGGFSGGSRVALRLALAYPDLFRGALLIAGSDPIGTAQLPLPPKPLFRQFQQTRLVYLTGQHDELSQAMDSRSRDSMQHWCVARATSIDALRSGHELPGPSTWSHALSALEQPAPSDPQRLAACRARVDASLQEQLRKAQALLEKGPRGAACKLLQDIDTRYGGLAAPRSVELMQQAAGDDLHSGTCPNH
jgi:pimeloyl-ACP methyl ester carboxylesterase